MMVYRYGASKPHIGHHEHSTAVTDHLASDDNFSCSEQEKSAKERIRDAALELFAKHGFNNVGLKTIARRAGVSAPLVVHHFGSKAQLRKACDRYAAERIRAAKLNAVYREGHFPQSYIFDAIQESSHLAHYIVRAFAEGGEEVDELFDQLIEDFLVYAGEAEELGQMRSSQNRRHRAVLLLLMTFGSLVLHKQMKRLLGSSPIDDPPEQWGPYVAAVSEIFLQGVLIPEANPDLVDFVERYSSPED
ncbi:TetR/AcrR family transcriptional regulator [Auritidibacter ignavus]|uniref:TetR/AcrR family transcriptional regulator n=1 Tax=Auritidibacter ignavus TaxID=678932 RepID=UPI002FE5EC2B